MDDRVELVDAPPVPVPACERCRSFKKKCSRSLPACTLCAAGGHQCLYSQPSDPRTHNRQLRARIEWLTRYLNNHPPPGGFRGKRKIDEIETGTDLDDQIPSAADSPDPPLMFQRPRHLDSHSRSKSPRGYPRREDEPPGRRSWQRSSGLNADDAGTQLGNTGSSNGGDGTLSTVPQPVLEQVDQQRVSSLFHSHILNQASQGSPSPISGSSVSVGSDQAPTPNTSVQTSLFSTSASGTTSSSVPTPDSTRARLFVEAYFRHVGRSYPCVDPARIWAIFEAGRDYFTPRINDRKWTLLFLVMAIGFSTLRRANQLPYNSPTKFDVPYADALHDCLVRPNMTSVQILVLLAICSLQDSHYPGTWTLMTIASREGIRLGLTRRSTNRDGDDDGTNEMRHRLYWSIYILDRRMATTLGVQPTISYEDADIPLPGLTINEFVVKRQSQLASTLQISHQAIQVGVLEEKILRCVHLQKPMLSANLSREARRHVIKTIRLNIENWYMQWCLLPPNDDSDNVFVQNSVTWISARYYYLLMLLYYPTYFNLCNDDFPGSPETVEVASKYVQSINILLQQHQLHLGRLTLCRLLPAALMLTYGFGNGGPHPAKDDITLLVGILDAFDNDWTHANKAANILRNLSPHVRETGRVGSIRYYDASHANSGMRAKQLWADLLELVQEVLGLSSSFCWALADHSHAQTRRQITSFPNSQSYCSGSGGGGFGFLSSIGLGSGVNPLDSFDMEAMSGLEGISSHWRQPLSPIHGDSLWQFDI